jgi:hypothetical protein
MFPALVCLSEPAIWLGGLGAVRPFFEGANDRAEDLFISIIPARRY